MVDDNREMCSLVQNICRQEGFNRVEAAFSSREAESNGWRRRRGFNHIGCQYARRGWILLLPADKACTGQKRIPVLFLSARDQDEDKLLGLGLGADDYMTKPFLPRELILRISAILRRTYQLDEKNSSIFRLGNREVDLSAGIVRVMDESGKTIQLTNKEYQLFKAVSGEPGKDTDL